MMSVLRKQAPEKHTHTHNTFIAMDYESTIRKEGFKKSRSRMFS